MVSCILKTKSNRLAALAWIAVGLLSCNLVLAQESALVGHWEGAYGRLGSIQTLSLDLTVRDGQLAGTYDIPELSLYGEPIKDIGGEFPAVTLHLSYGKFSMRASSEADEMTGENRKWNPPLTLHLKRRPKPPELRMATEAVKFSNGRVSLAGTLVKPRSVGLHPAIVIVHGSGGQGRDDNYYAIWGGFFAEHGLTTLIYDKRGVGESTGNFEKATFDDLAGDVIAGLELLKSREDIDKSRIGLFGMSQGGWLVPLVASRTDGVRFAILNVGPAVTVREQELHRVEYSMRADEASEEDIHSAVDYTRQVFEVAYSEQGSEALLAKTEDVASKPWADYVSLVRTEDDLRDWRLIRYDPAPALTRMKLPVLSLFGEHDVLVPPEENVDKMRAYLTEAGNSDFEIHVIPGATHNMETYGSLKGGAWDWPEKYWVWPRKAPEFYPTILAWLAKHGFTTAE